MSRQSRSMAAEPAPHSWDLEHWPTVVYPHTSGRARYLIRSQKTSLIEAGALSRVGRELIVLGAAYTKWLERQAVNVQSFECAANRRTATESRDAT